MGHARPRPHGLLHAGERAGHGQARGARRGPEKARLAGRRVDFTGLDRRQIYLRSNHDGAHWSKVSETPFGGVGGRTGRGDARTPRRHHPPTSQWLGPPRRSRRAAHRLPPAVRRRRRNLGRAASSARPGPVPVPAVEIAPIDRRADRGDGPGLGGARRQQPRGNRKSRHAITHHGVVGLGPNVAAPGGGPAGAPGREVGRVGLRRAARRGPAVRLPPGRRHRPARRRPLAGGPEEAGRRLDSHALWPVAAPTLGSPRAPGHARRSGPVLRDDGRSLDRRRRQLLAPAGGAGFGDYRLRYYPRSLQIDDGTIYVFGHNGWDNRYGEVDQSIDMDKFRLARK